MLCDRSKKVLLVGVIGLIILVPALMSLRKYRTSDSLAIHSQSEVSPEQDTGKSPIEAGEGTPIASDAQKKPIGSELTEVPIPYPFKGELMSNNILFFTKGNSNLSESALRSLSTCIAFLISEEGKTFTVHMDAYVGFDEMGFDATDNDETLDLREGKEQLARRRVAAITAILRGAGIPEERISFSCSIAEPEDTVKVVEDYRQPKVTLHFLESEQAESTT